MKKTIIGSIVGGLLIFIWQTLSWTVLDIHRSTQDYTPKQDTIMNFLNATLEKEGGYMMPIVPKGSSMEEVNKNGEKAQGKPWASIQYHKSFSIDMNAMAMNMIRGLLSTMIMVWLFIWILGKVQQQGFVNILMASLFTGLIIFIYEPYNTYIWYKIFDIRAHLADAIIGWGLNGIWLGWYLGKKS
jgi:hypothetical protein